MATSRKRGVGRTCAAREHDDSDGVSDYLKGLEHPLKPVVEAVRATILGVDSAITEGMKWNSASFFCHGWFATVSLRPKGPLQVVLHHGAKVRPGADLGRTMEDPLGLLKWLSVDRAAVPFANLDDFEAKRAAFSVVIRQWAEYQKQRANAGADDGSAC
jgi:hypothetical protein